MAEKILMQKKSLKHPANKAFFKYLPDIKAGRLVGYDNPKQAEQDRKIFYPEIIGNR